MIFAALCILDVRNTSIDVGINSAFKIEFRPRNDVMDNAVMITWEAIIPTDAPLPFANGTSIAKMKTPTNVPLVAAFTNIEISITPLKILTIYAMAMQMIA